MRFGVLNAKCCQIDAQALHVDWQIVYFEEVAFLNLFHVKNPQTPIWVLTSSLKIHSLRWICNALTILGGKRIEARKSTKNKCKGTRRKTKETTLLKTMWWCRQVEVGSIERTKFWLESLKNWVILSVTRPKFRIHQSAWDKIYILIPQTLIWKFMNRWVSRQSKIKACRRKIQCRSSIMRCYRHH